MPLQIIEPLRIYQRIAAQIGDMIRGGEFKPGQRLPPERDLAKTFGVSRNVVREAMVALEIAGLVDVRVGAGTFVAARAKGAEAAELRGARALIESEIAALAAECRTDTDAAAIREAAERVAAEAGNQAAQWRRRFHLRIAEATRNHVLVSVVRQLWGSGPEEGAPGLDSCRRIAQAIADRDAAGARAAMRAHFGGADPAAGARPATLTSPSGPPASSRTRREAP